MSVAACVWLLVLAPAQGEAELRLTYQTPSATETSLDALKITEWKAGDHLFLGVDEANLRAEPKKDGALVATLRLGTPVEVLEVGAARERVADRVDRWVKLKTLEGPPKEGFIFGAVLTPLARRMDLDGDGAEERVAVVYSPEFKPRVRVYEPSMKGKWVVATQDLDRVDGTTSGGTLRWLEVTGGKGKPRMVALADCAGTLCSVTVLQYTADKGKLGSLGTVLRGVESMGDTSPVVTARPGEVKVEGLSARLVGDRWVPYVRVFPMGSDTEVIPVTWAPGGQLVMLHFESEARGPDPDAPCDIYGTVAKGTHKGKEVIGCTVGLGGKVGPNTVSLAWFIKLKKKKLGFLQSSSDAYTDDVLDKLRAKRFEVEHVSGVLAGAYNPATLYEDDRGSLVRSDRTPEGTPTGPEVIAFEHEVLGKVPMEVGSDSLGGIALRQGDGSMTNFKYRLAAEKHGEIKWRPSTTSTAEHAYTSGRRVGCESQDEYWDSVVVAVPQDELEPAGVVLPGMFQVFKMKTEPRKARVERLEELGISQDFETTPPLYIRDSFGRWLELLPSAINKSCMAEPIVYFYPPHPMTVHYQLGANVALAHTQPPMPNNGITLEARPGGTFADVTGRRHSWLFWEGTSSRAPHPGTGDVVRREDVAAYFSRVLPVLGLQGREIEDFKDAWIPRLSATPYYLIHFYSAAEVEVRAPVTVTPAPDSNLRLLMDALPLQEEVDAPSSPLPQPPARGAFAVVEWGGIVR